jgi:uncharacterized protein (TIGR01244 family)
MLDIRSVTPAFAVAPQIAAEDFAAVAAAGYRIIVNNRPDGEAPDQLPSAAARQAAEAAGLAYVHIPVAGGPRRDQVEETANVLAAAEGPVFAYCRSGTRSITLWALAQAAAKAAPPATLIATAAEAGYDLSAMRPALEGLAAG